MGEKITLVIVDDEKPARIELKRLLSRFKDVEVVGEAEDGLQAIKLIRRIKPEVILLDIQMPGLDGFQVIEKIKGLDKVPFVIFITAYDEYAIRAFEVNAIDYILKPVEEERLAEAIQRARGGIGDSGRMPDLEALLRALKPAKKRIALRVGESIVMVDVDDIIYATVSSGELKVVTEKVEGSPSLRSLDELSRELPPEQFVRVHRAYIANVDKIHEITPWFNGSYRIKMKDEKGPVIPLSRNQAKELRKRFNW